MGSRWRLVVLAGLFTLVTACGGGAEGSDGVASVSGDKSGSAASEDGKTDEDKMREYAACMRKHGVDVGESGPDTGGGSGSTDMEVDADVDPEKIEKADKECMKLLPNGGELAAPSAEDLDEARRMAQCMREHGIEVPDPTAEDPGITITGDGDPEQLNKAMKACQPEGADSGTGSVGGGT